MTTSTGDLEITYEGEALTFGGYVSADFFVTRPGHPGLEVNLGLAADAQALIEETSGTLDDEGAQAILRSLAGRMYRSYIDAGREPPAILLLRADDIDARIVPDLLAEAGLS